jgi:hypothetical protein
MSAHAPRTFRSGLDLFLAALLTLCFYWYLYRFPLVVASDLFLFMSQGVEMSPTVPLALRQGSQIIAVIGSLILPDLLLFSPEATESAWCCVVVYLLPTIS